MCAPHSLPQLSSHYDHTEGYNRVCVLGVLPLWDFCRFLFDFLVLTSAITQMLPVELSWTRLLNCRPAHVSVHAHKADIQPGTTPGPPFHILSRNIPCSMHLAILSPLILAGTMNYRVGNNLRFLKLLKSLKVRNSTPLPHKRTYTFNQWPLFFFSFAAAESSLLWAAFS